MSSGDGVPVQVQGWWDGEGAFALGEDEHMLQQMFDVRQMAMVTQALGGVGGSGGVAGESVLMPSVGAEDVGGEAGQDVSDVGEGGDTEGGMASGDKKRALNRLAQQRYRKRKKEKAQELDEKARQMENLKSENTRLLLKIEGLLSSVKAKDQDLAKLREHNERLFDAQAQMLASMQQGGKDAYAVPPAIERPAMLALANGEGGAHGETVDVDVLCKLVDQAVKRIMRELACVDEEFLGSMPDATKVEILGMRGGGASASDETGSASEENDSLVRSSYSGGRLACDVENGGSCGSLCASRESPTSVTGRKKDAPEKFVWKNYSAEDMERMSRHMEPFVQDLFRVRQELMKQMPCNGGMCSQSDSQGGPGNAPLARVSAKFHPQSFSRCDIMKRWRHIARVMRISDSQSKLIIGTRDKIAMEGEEIYTRRKELLLQALEQTTKRMENLDEFHRRNMITMMCGESTILCELKELLHRELKLQDQCKDAIRPLSAWQLSRMISESYPNMPDCFYLSAALKDLGYASQVQEGQGGVKEENNGVVPASTDFPHLST